MQHCLFLNNREIGDIRRRLDQHEWARNIYARVERSARRRKVKEHDENVWDWGHIIRDKALVTRIARDDRHLPAIWKKMASVFRTDVMDEPPAMGDDWGFGLFHSNFIWTFDLLREHPGFPPQLRTRLEQRFREALQMQIAAVDPAWDYCFNTRFWYTGTIGTLGFLFDDSEAVDLAINGNMGFKAALEWFRDGLWHEATVYGHHYVSCCMVMLAEASRHCGGEDLYACKSSRGDTLKSLYDGMIAQLFADGRVATCGDQGHQSEYQSRLEKDTGHDIGDTFLFNNRSYRENNRFDIVYRAYRDPVHAWLLAQNPRRDFWDHTFWGYAGLTHGVALGPRRPPSARSIIFPRWGAAMVRSVEDETYWQSKSPAVFVRDGCDQNHGHLDQFNIVLNAFGKNIYPDWFYQWDYAKGRHTRGRICNRKDFSRHTLAHNTMIVDRLDPKKRVYMTMSAVTQSGPAHCLTMQGMFWPGVEQKRVLALTHEYLLDIFSAASMEPHTYDYLLHSFGRLTVKGVGRQRPVRCPGREYGYNLIDTEARRKDNTWLRPGWRASVESPWQARFSDSRDGIGSNVFVLDHAITTVTATNTPYFISCWGWDDPPEDGCIRKRPFLIVRRKARNTVFTVVHQPFDPGTRKISVQRDGDHVSVTGAAFHDEIDLGTMRVVRRS